jgi:hypothetical protein
MSPGLQLHADGVSESRSRNLETFATISLAHSHVNHARRCTIRQYTSDSTFDRIKYEVLATFPQSKSNGLRSLQSKINFFHRSSSVLLAPKSLVLAACDATWKYSQPAHQYHELRRSTRLTWIVDIQRSWFYPRLTSSIISCLLMPAKKWL